MEKHFKIYTDGAYSPNRDQGGIGIIWLKNDIKVSEFYDMYPNTTNNRMELTAIIIGLKAIIKPVNSITIYSDSMYCIGTITKNWKRKSNQDLWKKFDKVMMKIKQLCPEIKFEHIDGHAGNKYNEDCDKIAVFASQLVK